jgi:hypothetical protein
MITPTTSKLSNSTLHLLKSRRGRVRSLLAIILLSMAVLASAVSAGYYGTGYVSKRINVEKSPLSANISEAPKPPLIVATVQDPLPPVTTDKTGYLVGETVNISGTGFAAGESVTIQVRHADNSAESGGGHDPFVVTALPDGTFSATWNLTRSDSAGNNFVVSAVGMSSGYGGTANFKRIATVRTDKFDYEQGETVAIQGNGFAANETVQIHVILLNGRPDGNGYSPFTTTSDDNGQITASWPVDPTALDSILLLTVRGNSSGLRAQTIFTDVVVTTIDDAGPDDEPGQKDLNQVSTDNGNLPTSIGLTWNWDDTAWSGNNTGDACSLFDTDADGFANFAICVTVEGDPAAFQDTGLFSCSDTRADRCSQATEILTFASSCTATIVGNSDPFRTNPAHTTGNTCDKKTGCYTDDTVAACTVQLADVGAANARLLNVCSFPSQQPGSDPSDCVITPNSGFLTIKKTTQTGSNTSTNFVFNTNPASQGGVSQFSQSISGQQSNVVVANMVSFAPTNSLSITEVVPSQWDLTGVTCQVQTNIPQNSGTFNGTNAVTGVSIQTGLETICTFTDAQRGSIKIVKNTVGGDDTFDFTSNFGVSQITTAGGTGEQTVNNLSPGTNYNISETDKVGWDEGTFSCDRGTAAAIEVVAGQLTTCTITNTKQGSIKVVKNTVGGNDTFDFTSNFGVSQITTAGGTGEQTVNNLSPGNGFSVSETVPAAWVLATPSCTLQGGGATGTAGATGVTNIVVQPGKTTTCTFTNSKRGTIIVVKQTNPDGASGSFTFTGTAAGTISDNGNITVPNLAPGTYYSTENNPTPNFDLTSITCDDGLSASASTGDVANRRATFRLDPGETVTCTFTNRQRGQVDVLKITNGGVHPELDIRFTLYRDGPDADPDLTGTDVQLEEKTTLGDADGLLQFAEKLVPGTTYTICENPVPAGWTSLWTIGFSVGGNIVTPYNPNANDPVPSDVGIRCFDFTVNPGETKHFEIHNDFPGGDPRTIGYWKNWNRCTGGGQAANAAKNGGPAAGFFVLEDLLPQLIGDFNVTSCLQAIKILGKQDQAGKSKSSDAAYELAAQLLAAKFNLAAGAETCQAVQDAVVAGQALLDYINFNGSGDYLGSKVKGALLTKRAQALSLANTLDQYNNGNLCP